MIIYMGSKASDRETLEFLTDLLADGYVFNGITMGYAKLKYTGHHDRGSKIGVMSKEDYEKLSEKEKAQFQYIDDYSGNVYYRTRKSISDNSFYSNKKEEKERNISNYIIGALVLIAVVVVIVKVVMSIGTQSIWFTLGEIFLQPIVFFLVFIPALIWLLAWMFYKVKRRSYDDEDSRENRKNGRKIKIIYNTVMQFASTLIQIGLALAPLIHR